MNFSKLICFPLTMICLVIGGCSTAVFFGKDASKNTKIYESPATLNRGQAFLKRLSGEWVVEKRVYPPDGAPVVIQGECHQAMINRGLYLKSDFTFYQGPSPDTEICITGFDPATGLFTSVWAGSDSTRMTLRQSKEPFDGRQIVQFSQSLGGDAKGKQLSHSLMQIHLENHDRKIIYQRYVINTNGSERMKMELILTNKAIDKAEDMDCDKEKDEDQDEDSDAKQIYGYPVHATVIAVDKENKTLTIKFTDDRNKDIPDELKTCAKTLYLYNHQYAKMVWSDDMVGQSVNAVIGIEVVGKSYREKVEIESVDFLTEIPHLML